MILIYYFNISSLYYFRSTLDLTYQVGSEVVVFVSMAKEMEGDVTRYTRKRTFDKTRDNFAMLCQQGEGSGLMVYIDKNGKLSTWCKYKCIYVVIFVDFSS